MAIKANPLTIIKIFLSLSFVNVFFSFFFKLFVFIIGFWAVPLPYLDTSLPILTCIVQSHYSLYCCSVHLIGGAFKVPRHLFGLLSSSQVGVSPSLCT